MHAEYAFLASPATSQKRLSDEDNLHGRPAAGTLHPSGSPSRAYRGPVFWQAPADWSLSRAYPRLLVHRMAVCTGRRLNVIWIYAIHTCALMNYGCNICLLMICRKADQDTFGGRIPLEINVFLNRIQNSL